MQLLSYSAVTVSPVQNSLLRFRIELNLLFILCATLPPTRFPFLIRPRFLEKIFRDLHPKNKYINAVSHTDVSFIQFPLIFPLHNQKLRKKCFILLRWNKVNTLIYYMDVSILPRTIKRQHNQYDLLIRELSGIFFVCNMSGDIEQPRHNFRLFKLC